ncbi:MULTISPECIES: hypothetical protein [Paenibacillus]|uniref:hypothetical protein n=1 Tax=Paenibacillus TaxID=44249 RepID=UPI0022B8AC45|nr:hypothetical protein [Paenibacillus caseinilyticus]MCZ8521185.1 hypothetical protein [Paenibacillus caseinilyticus]
MDRLLALDAKVFPPNYRIDAATTEQRLSVNPYTDIAVLDGEELMGYVSLYPIPRAIYQEIRSGTFDEKRVERHTLPYRRIGKYDAYLCSIAIDKARYPRLRAAFLFGQLSKHLMALKRRGMFIRRIIAHAVSAAGRKTLERMGFREGSPGIYCYHCIRQGLHFIRPRSVVSVPPVISPGEYGWMFSAAPSAYNGESVWDTDT